MICLVGKLPVLKIGRHQVPVYGTEWIDRALARAAESANRADFPFIDDIRDGVLHYLEHKCPWRLLPIEDLFARMKRMLCRIGCEEIAKNLEPLAPPIKVSIARAAREAGNDRLDSLSPGSRGGSLGESVRPPAGAEGRGPRGYWASEGAISSMDRAHYESFLPPTTNNQQPTTENRPPAITSAPSHGN